MKELLLAGVIAIVGIFLAAGLLLPAPSQETQRGPDTACIAEATQRLRPFRTDYAQMANTVCEAAQAAVRDNHMSRRDAISAGIIIAGGH